MAGGCRLRQVGVLTLTVKNRERLICPRVHSGNPGCTSDTRYGRGAAEAADTFSELLPTAEIDRRGILCRNRLVGNPTYALRVSPTEGDGGELKYLITNLKSQALHL